MEQAGASASRPASVRFLAFCGEPSSLRQWLLSLVPSVDRPERLNRILDCGDLVVYASPETPVVRLEAEKGLVLGELIGGRRCRRAADRLGMAEALYHAICRDVTGLDLPQGEYVAFLRGCGKIAVLRSRTGALAAQYFETMGLTALSSHAELCRQVTPAVPDIHMLKTGIVHWFSAGKLQDHSAGGAASKHRMIHFRPSITI